VTSKNVSLQKVIKNTHQSPGDLPPKYLHTVECTERYNNDDLAIWVCDGFDPGCVYSFVLLLLDMTTEVIGFSQQEEQLT
jgi:hypothetical protein